MKVRSVVGRAVEYAGRVAALVGAVTGGVTFVRGQGTAPRVGSFGRAVLNQGKHDMQRIAAPCGLICRECEAYQATQAEDADAIAAVAAEWRRRYAIAFSPDDLWCDGCTSSSERTARHTRECPVRCCAMGRGMATCAECGDYRCEQLTRLHRLVPQAHETLEALRRRSR